MRNLLRLNSNQREYAAPSLPPLPPPLALPLLLCSSRTVNKNRLHVKLCLASVKRSSTIDSNRPEHDVASVPPATTSLLPLPHRSLYPAGAAILHALWLHLLAGFVCASAFFLSGLLSLFIFWHFYYYFFIFCTFFSLLCFLDVVVSSCGRH